MPRQPPRVIVTTSSDPSIKCQFVVSQASCGSLAHVCCCYDGLHWLQLTQYGMLSAPPVWRITGNCLHAPSPFPLLLHSHSLSIAPLACRVLILRFGRET